MRDRLYWLVAWAILGVLVIFLLVWEFPRHEWKNRRNNRKFRKEAMGISTAKSNCRLRLEILLLRLKETTERLKLWKS